LDRRFRRYVVPFTLVVLLAVTGAAAAGISDPSTPSADTDRPHSGVPAGFEPAVLRAEQGLGRYIVVVDGPSVATAAGPSAGSQARVAADARAAQKPAIAAAKAAGGDVVFRYDTLLNGFSAAMSPRAAAQLADRSDVASVEPVSIVRKLNETSVPFIGATKTWKKLGVKGQGITVADVDTGIDYTHKNFGGPGTVAAYEANDPNVIEPGTFPTKKVIGGYDLVGSDYEVLDDDPTNDIPRPDPDPLDGVDDDHGSHTSGTCCGNGVKGQIGPGVAPKSKLLAIKVWDEGDSTDDVLVAGFERAMDPNDDGKIKDAADVITFSGGVDYGTENSAEAVAAQRVVDLGTVFVAAAGNAGNQPVGGSAYIAGTPANAPGVISVAASIDQFTAQTISINSPSIELPDQGIMVVQDFGGGFPDGGITGDLYDGRQLDPPADPGNEAPADAQFCSSLPAGSLAGKIVLVFKGATGEGDCAGSKKAFNAQQAGAQAVVLISLFGGAPSGLSTDGEPITIPVVMISGNDGYAILDELSPGSAYNSGTVNATLNSDTTIIDSYTDAMTDFTSEGPARLTNDLKPDISAPGYDIQSTDAGTGNKGIKFSGTSMATPHIAGVAALLVQLHPKWSPDQIKAALMNQAVQDLKDNLLGSPVSATVMGSGRVDAFGSATTVSLADPASLSYGLDIASGSLRETRSFKVENVGELKHRYNVAAKKARYSDFGASPASVTVSSGGGFGKKLSFGLKPGESQKVKVRLALDPSAIEEAEQEYGLYYFHPNVDGNVAISQNDAEKHKLKEAADKLHVPWHVAPLAASDNSLSKDELDLSGGPGTMTVKGDGAGTSEADLYLLGATDGLESHGEEDLVAVGARSFTGDDLSDDQAEGVPGGTDAFAGISWLDFLADPDPPAEPVEFGVQTAGIHNTTETLEVDVLVDTGADGVYAGADEGIDADYLLVKQAAPGGEVCVFDLSQPDALDECAATYFADYSNYNSNVIGLPVSAGDIGLTNADSKLAYQVTACTGTFSGDVPGQFCDTAGTPDENTGVYDAQIDVADPALDIDPLTCGGFFGGGACDGSDPIEVSAGSAGPGDDPSILALFPNNKPSRDPVIVTTTTGP
jgi:subtilisin family serine protease